MVHFCPPGSGYGSTDLIESGSGTLVKWYRTSVKDPETEEEACLEHGVCYGICHTDGFCFKSLTRKGGSLRRTYR